MTQMVSVAKLDADGVYFGLEDRAIDTLRSGDVVFNAEALEHGDIAGVTWVAGGCDLAPGRFRWSRDRGTFDALNLAQARQSPNPPLIERAFYADILQRVSLGGAKEVPQYTLDWALWYESTFDANQDTGRPLARQLGRS